MPAVTIRNLSEEAHRALKTRAARNERSTEAEIRAILEDAVKPENRPLIGTALSAIGKKHGINRADVECLEQVRDKRPANPTAFE